MAKLTNKSINSSHGRNNPIQSNFNTIERMAGATNKRKQLQSIMSQKLTPQQKSSQLLSESDHDSGDDEPIDIEQPTITNINGNKKIRTNNNNSVSQSTKQQQPLTKHNKPTRDQEKFGNLFDKANKSSKQSIKQSIVESSSDDHNSDTDGEQLVDELLEDDSGIELEHESNVSESDVSDSDELDSEIDINDDQQSDSSELPIERAARKLEKQHAYIQQQSDAELLTAAQSNELFELPTAEQLELEQINPLDNTQLKQRIDDIISVLNNFRQLKQSDKSRSEYMTQLHSDLSNYYGYLPELIDKLSELFAPAELIELLDSNEQSRPLTIRTNTLKIRRRELAQLLINRGVNLDPLGEWSKIGLKIYDSQVPVGATPEYLAGYYILQSASSLLPVMALAPQSNDKIADICASPGGKTTYISALMKNTGILLANDINTKRLPSLVYNIHRLGCTNTIVTNYDGRKLGQHHSQFNRILLDAPCSGMGVISRDPSIKLQKTVNDILNCSHLQKELLINAIDMLCVNKTSNGNDSGYIVYSTCSITVEENEDVIQYALNKRYVKLVDTGLTFGRSGFTRIRDRRYHPSMSMTRRYYPHVHNMDGFYVAKLKKYQNGVRVVDEQENEQSAATANGDDISDEHSVDDNVYVNGELSEEAQDESISELESELSVLSDDESESEPTPVPSNQNKQSVNTKQSNGRQQKLNGKDKR